MQVIITTPKELEETIIRSLNKFGLRPPNEKNPTFTINQVAKRLGMSHHTIKKRIKQGFIKTTADGRITEQAVNDFLQVNQ